MSSVYWHWECFHVTQQRQELCKLNKLKTKIPPSLTATKSIPFLSPYAFEFALYFLQNSKDYWNYSRPPCVPQVEAIPLLRRVSASQQERRMNRSGDEPRSRWDDHATLAFCAATASATAAAVAVLVSCKSLLLHAKPFLGICCWAQKAFGKEKRGHNLQGQRKKR